MLTAAGGYTAGPEKAAPPASPGLAAGAKPGPEKKMTENRFDDLYAQWQVYIHKPRVRLSSNPRDYVNCKPFREMTALGPLALPRLIEKMKQGNSSGWKESQFFLWRAVKEISGTDLSRGGELSGQQEIARLYINWWETRRQKK